ncbi:uncharacterized protein LOC119737664 [Patiria miniata]|uniref:RNase NYN domain-containing protein n=1 Tax=Patiria miniata TaxID=46514 RepID=A0A914AWG3_PATMI|nr:uncharacterized protein LOC119737664 [Patiria miniata]
MIMEFEEHSQGPTKVQFTVSRSSLPNLLEWTERLQVRFRVAIDIQWELDAQAARISEAKQVRWVSLSGDAADCTKAQKYITIFCDAMHKMNITYPESIHTELKESQTKLEENYSCVLQFLKKGELLAKSNDEMNLSLILSVIEEKDVQFQHRNFARLMQPFPRQSAPEKHPKSDDVDDMDLDVDSMTVESPNDNLEHPLMRSRSPFYSQTPTKQRDLLGGDPLKLKGEDEVIIQGQPSRLLIPASSKSSISPDRKKIKSHLHLDQGSSSESSSPFYLGRTYSGSLLELHLNSQQMLAVQRLKERGDFTQTEIDRVLQKVGSDWECSDLITMLRREQTQKSIPSAASRRTKASATNLEKLKNTQESLMRSLREQSSPDRSQIIFSQFNPKSSSTPATWTHEAQIKETPVVKSAMSIKEEEYDPHFNEDDKQLEREHVVYDDDFDSVITVDETDSIIVIPSESEPEIVIGDSSEESETHEEFYIKGVLQEKPKKASGSRLAKRSTKPRQFGHVDVPLAVREKQDELQGVIESLRQQITDLQDKTERDRAEASSQQQVANLLQQTQLEEMERQYLQQQQRLLEQQREFQKQFEMQEQKLKEQQETALKQLQQQQQQQQEKLKQEQAQAAAEDPSEAIVIAPAKRTPASPLRPVVIDGSNVAMGHGRNKIYSCRGIAICIQYFQRRGHRDITVFVPQGRRTQNPKSLDRPMKDQQILEQLEKQGLLSFTPSRRIGSTYVNCYDDRFIVELAVENDGVIVSNDNYRDLMGESPKWKYVIENRLVMYTFAGDRFMIPDDPLGRKGPRIDQILQRSHPPRTVAAAFGSHQILMAPAPAGPVIRAIPGLAVPMMHTTAGIVPQWGTRGTAGAQAMRHVAATSQARPKPAPSAAASKAAAKPEMAPSVGQNPAQWRTGGKTGAQVVRHGATTSQARPKPAPSTSTSASKAASKPDVVPSGGQNPAQWGTSGKTGAQVVRHGAATSQTRPKPAPSTSTSASKAASKPEMAPPVGQKPAQDPKNHPCYDILMGIFPSNEEEVLRVLAKNSSTEDANELVIQVLVEKEKSES